LVPKVSESSNYFMIKSIFFFCCPIGTPDKTGYEHQIISIAEGLREIGVEFYSNINYWCESHETDSFLLTSRNDLSFEDCGVVVFSSNYLLYQGRQMLPDNLFAKERNYQLVYIDDSDGLITDGFNLSDNVDLVLKSHFNKKYIYPSNFRPWQFGLTNRIITSALPHQTGVRKNKMLVNFRVHHSVREEAKNKVIPVISKYFSINGATEDFAENESVLDQLYWRQTGRRHYENYYSRLSESVACACFGGYFQKTIPFQGSKFGYILRHLDYKFKLFSYNKVYQYDSWRFWESLAAGCCTFHVDLDKYGAVLPVMPVNGVHYLGVNFDDLAFLEKQLEKGTDYLEKIGEQGRQWAMNNYSPVSTATRFLDLLNSD